MLGKIFASTKFKSFSINTLKSGWKVALKLTGENNKEYPISFQYEPKKRSKNFVIQFLDQKIKAKAKVTGDKIVVDVKIPMVVSILLSRVGSTLSSDVHLEFDADMFSMSDNGKTISVKGIFAGEEFKAELQANEKKEVVGDRTYFKQTQVTISVEYGGQTFSAKGSTNNEYEIDNNIYEILEEAYRRR